MKKIPNVAIAATLLLALTTLGGCQLSQSGSSTYAGAKIGKTVSNQRASLRINSPQPISVTEDSALDAVDAGPDKKRRSKSRAKGTSAKKPQSTADTPHNNRKRRAYANGSRSAYDAIIRRYARANGVPYRLARAVVQVESGFRRNARGKVGEIGLMQIRKSTARGMGYRGTTRALYNPETNIRLGMRYLGKAYRLGGKTTCGAILKYNAGHGAKRMNPVSKRYCNKVRKIIGS